MKCVLFLLSLNLSLYVHKTNFTVKLIHATSLYFFHVSQPAGFTAKGWYDTGGIHVYIVHNAVTRCVCVCVCAMSVYFILYV